MTPLEEYNSIICLRQRNPLPDDAAYEDHHIIPRCCKGTNAAWNMVKLTPQEHFRAHHLLAKIYKGRKEFFSLSSAAWLMSHTRDGLEINEDEYAEIKKNFVEYLKKRKPPMLGRHFTEEHRKHMSEARKGIPRPDMKGRKPWNKGTKGMFHHTEEWKKEQSKRSKGRKMSEEAKRKLSESAKKRTSYSFTGHHHTEESKQKIRLAHLGKGHTEETKKVLSEKAKQQWASYTEEQRKLFKAQLLEARKKITYKKGRTPWNKGKKGCQVAWNKGKKGCQVAWNKGKKFTEEQRKHMSEAQLKYYSDPMHAPWNKGKTGVQVAWNKGKNLTEEHRKHLVEAKRRRKNLNETGKN